jgi:hypothetical protein
MTLDRALRPYPPAGIESVDSGGLLISWKNRNRLHTAIRKQTDATDTPEVGQTTTVRIYSDANVLLHTETGITGTDWTYSNAEEIADAGALQLELRIKVKAVRDGYESLDQSHTHLRADRVVVGVDTVTFGGDTVIII